MAYTIKPKLQAEFIKKTKAMSKGKDKGKIVKPSIKK